jgi:hypothetical protein
MTWEHLRAGEISGIRHFFDAHTSTLDTHAHADHLTGLPFPLAAPELILPSIQVNARAGELPAPSTNGIAYLAIPLDAFGKRR